MAAIIGSRDGNEVFLRDGFGADWERVLIISFPHSPKAGLPGQWVAESTGSRRRRGAWPLRADWNNYFGISLFHGDHHRQEVLFEQMVMLAVDDVGDGPTCKRDAGWLLGRLGTPAYAWETSPGNQQWFYLLAPRVTDLGRARALGLWTGSDAKAVTRVMRLPVGRNTKDELGFGPAGFAVRPVLNGAAGQQGLVDIADYWDVVSQDVGTRATRGVGGLSTQRARSIDDLVGEDVVGNWLQKLGMVKGLTGNGLALEIECPWEDEHTIRTDTGAAYFPKRAGFECHHEHCQHRTGKDLRAWLEDHLKSSGLYEGGTASEQFDKVNDPGPGTPRVEFLRDVIYVRVEDKFWTLADRELLGRDALNNTWRKRLRPLLIDMREQAGGKGNLMEPSRAFFEMEDHQEVSKVTYWPGRQRVLIDGEMPRVNLWTPPARPFKGQTIDPDDVAFFRDLVRDVVGGEGPQQVEMFEDWVAVVIGAPEIKPGWVAILFSEEHGIGKDLILLPLRQGVGEENVSSPTAAELGTQFSYYLAARLMLISEFGRNTKGTPTTKDLYHILKPITENTSQELRVRTLGMKPFRMPNIVASAITTNEVDGMPMDESDRRFAVFTPIAGMRRMPDEYATIRARLLGDDGARVVEYYHQRYATMPQARRDVVLGHAPMTQAKQTMIQLGESRLEAWLREQFEDETFPDLMTWDDIEQRCERAYRKIGSVPSARRAATILRKLGARQLYSGNTVRLKGQTKRQRLWAIRGWERFEGMTEKQLADVYDAAQALSNP